MTAHKFNLPIGEVRPGNEGWSFSGLRSYCENGGEKDLSDMSWAGFWETLYKVAETVHVLEGTKKKKKEDVRTERPQGLRASLKKAAPGGSRSGARAMVCFWCGSKEHHSDCCDHEKGKLIKKGEDRRWPMVCYRCFKPGHQVYDCETNKGEDNYQIEDYVTELDWLAKWEEEEEKISQGEVVGQNELYYCFTRDLDPADWDNPDLVLEGANGFGGLLGVVEEGEEAELKAQEPEDVGKLLAGVEKEVSQVEKE